MTNTILKIEITAINVNTNQSFEKQANNEAIADDIVNQHLPIIKCLEPEFFYGKADDHIQIGKVTKELLPTTKRQGFSFTLALELNLDLPLRFEHLKSSAINMNTESGTYDVVEHMEIHDGAITESLTYEGNKCLTNNSYRKASETALKHILQAEDVNIKYTRSLVCG